jgi:2'-5' RNA ligase
MIRTYQQFLESKSGKLYRYGCVMVYLDIPNWENIVSHIDQEDLYKPEVKRFGLETDPHVTILYGLHSDVNDEDVINVFKDISSNDIVLNVDGIGIFENPEFDVIKMNVKSDTLSILNEELKKLPHTSDYPDYKPHITIAYLLPGTGKKYIESDYKYTFNQVKKIIYSKANGQKIEISID